MHNSEHLLRKLEKKGWGKEEMDHARFIFSEHQLHHHIIHPIWDSLLHWILFAVILASNIAAFFFMLPLIIVFNNIFSYFFVAILGFALGLAFEAVLSDQTHFEKHHHFFVHLIIPATSVVLMLITMYVLKQQFSGVTFGHPLSISLLYAAFFILPYYVAKLKR